jgi:hypothetical protein
MRYLLPSGAVITLDQTSPVVATEAGFAVAEVYTQTRLSPQTFEALAELGADMGYAVRACACCNVVLGLAAMPADSTFVGKDRVSHGLCTPCIATMYPDYAAAVLTGARS